MPNARNLFYTAHDAGYVIFHKEPSTIQENHGRLVKYAFLKLEKSLRAFPRECVPSGHQTDRRKVFKKERK